MPIRRRLLLTALILVLPAVGIAHARLDDAAFRKAAATAKKLMSKAGRVTEKLPLIKSLEADDTRRTMRLVFAWSRGSRAFVAKKLAPELTKRQEAYDKYDAKMLKKYKGERTGWSDLDASRHGKRRSALEEAQGDVATETRVQKALAKLVSHMKDADTLGWLSKTGVPEMLADRVEGPLLEACLGRLLESPPSAVATSIMAVLQRKLEAASHIRALLWVGQHKPKDAAQRLGPSLAAASPAVRRAAIKVMTLLDDRRSVPLLIEALKANDGLPGAEIETLLQRFTGKKFAADHVAWKRWWTTEGEAWLDALEAAKRFDPLSMSGGVSFYGLRSPSKRVAFVLDRSGSMKAPAVHHTGAAPTTGGEKESWAGKTRLEVAKIQLARTINNLASDVLFTLIFYDYEVDVWKKPPLLVDAGRKNKADAQKWFMKLEPGSSTSMFDGMMKALDYAEDLGAEKVTGDRIDTIFLLSDGQPTHFRGKDLKNEVDILEAYEVFKQANGDRRIVVHAIGVGQGHNEDLMRKIAQESGGKYVAVGMD